MRSLAPSLTLLLGTTGMSLVAACLLLSAPAHGFTMQDHAGMADASHDGHTLAGMDSDHDGRISRTEFAAAHDGKSERFAGIDSDGALLLDHDGALHRVVAGDLTRGPRVAGT